jgi:hypothetical protein
MGKQRRKPHQSFKPRESWNLQAPKMRVQSQGPSRKGLPVAEPLPKTLEEAMARAMYTLMGMGMSGEDSGNYQGMIVAFYTAPFDKKQ